MWNSTASVGSSVQAMDRFLGLVRLRPYDDEGVFLGGSRIVHSGPPSGYIFEKWPMVSNK